MSDQKHRMITNYFTRIVALFFLLAGFSAAPALAQENSSNPEWKVAYVEARKAAQNNNYDKAYEGFKRASQLAEQAGNQQIARGAAKVAAQIDYNLGVQHLKSQEFEQAVERFNNGIELFPLLAQNYWGKAQAQRKMEQPEEAIATFEQAIQAGQEAGNSGLVTKAKSKIRDYYVFKASEALSASDVSASSAQEALGYLSQLEQYDIQPDADIYFYRGTAQSALGNHEQAVNLADQAIQASTGSRSDKARMYFLKGESLMKLGNNSEARAAFQNATYGDYKQPAQHYLEQLSG